MGLSLPAAAHLERHRAQRNARRQAAEVRQQRAEALPLAAQPGGGKRTGAALAGVHSPQRVGAGSGVVTADYAGHVGGGGAVVGFSYTGMLPDDGGGGTPGQSVPPGYDIGEDGVRDQWEQFDAYRLRQAALGRRIRRLMQDPDADPAALERLRARKTFVDEQVLRLSVPPEPDIGFANGLGTGGKALFNTAWRHTSELGTLGYYDGGDLITVDPALDIGYETATIPAELAVTIAETIATGGAARLRYAGKVIEVRDALESAKDTYELADRMRTEGLTPGDALQLAEQLISRRKAGGGTGGNGRGPGGPSPRHDAGAGTSKVSIRHRAISI